MAKGQRKGEVRGVNMVKIQDTLEGKCQNETHHNV